MKAIGTIAILVVCGWTMSAAALEEIRYVRSTAPDVVITRVIPNASVGMETVETAEVIKGKIIAIDGVDKTVTLKDKRGVEWTFKVQNMTPTTWRVGDKVEAEYSVSTTNAVNMVKIKQR